MAIDDPIPANLTTPPIDIQYVTFSEEINEQAAGRFIHWLDLICNDRPRRNAVHIALQFERRDDRGRYQHAQLSERVSRRHSHHDVQFRRSAIRSRAGLSQCRTSGRLPLCEVPSSSRHLEGRVGNEHRAA
jgi:hypothetical protein